MIKSKKNLKILLDESIHDSAFVSFRKTGYNPIKAKSDEIYSNLGEIDIIGIRSTIKIKGEKLQKLQNGKLLAIGCYTVGYNNVDVEFARSKGIVVFNSPYDSTRSVAEETMARIYALAKNLTIHNSNMHLGKWIKSGNNPSIEILGKTLGVIGYGNIGSQVGQLAELNGMDVFYYDIRQKQSYGTNKPLLSLRDLLKESDFVTLHVPLTNETINMVAKEQLEKMKDGSFLINTSRGKVVDLDALSEVILNNKLSGAAIDVFPDEPEIQNSEFRCSLTGIENVILSPHVAGSSSEAQERIGVSVTRRLIKFIENGNSEDAILFPNIRLDYNKDSYRILYVHKNLPGADAQISSLLSEEGLNVNSKVLKTFDDIGYLIIDVDKNHKKISGKLVGKINELDKCIRVRIV